MISQVISHLFTSVNAQNIRLTLPPSDGNPDIAMGSTQVQGQGYMIYDYIQLVNTYLWTAMIVLLFALLIRSGVKIMTNPTEAKATLKTALSTGGIGIVIVIFSYTIVRLVINFL